jgi:hypothetical protein
MHSVMNSIFATHVLGKKYKENQISDIYEDLSKFGRKDVAK